MKTIPSRQRRSPSLKTAEKMAVRPPVPSRPPVPNRNSGQKYMREKARVVIPAQDGCIFVVSDQHYFPGDPPTPAHLASLLLAEQLKPFAIIANGDAIDGASISRWPVSSFTELGNRPAISLELNEVVERFKEYEELSTRWCIWNLGNHDARFETRLAERVPEYAGVNGFTLKDHFPGWIPAWSTLVVSPSNEPLVVVKHRFKGGEYSAYNNTMKAGISIVTGHDHRLWIKPITDYRGMRWGVDAGTMSDIHSPHFVNYTEDNPVDWQSGFAILHFRDGKLTGPELVWVLPNERRALFRGDVIKV